MAAGRKRTEIEIRQTDALHFFHGVAGLKEAVAQRIAARVGERGDVPGGVLAAHARDAGAGGAR